MSVFAVVRLIAHPGKGGAIRDMLNGGMLEVAPGRRGSDQAGALRERR